ncbi:DUF1580 domain-containing protein [Aeoliella sp.]|uniref:DUF1580 domain-containing protein n=1 Tax=Aeoliella sp. TaxID=2795800 RepID=UPI003CCC2AD8
MASYLSVADAAKRFPGSPHVNSVRRWMQVGCRGVKLRSIRFGGKRLTTTQWCDEFDQAVRQADSAVTSEHHQAQAKLAAMGV